MSHYISRRGGWFRIAGWGLTFTGTRPLFSERNGIRRPLLRFGRWRVFLLRPDALVRSRS